MSSQTQINVGGKTFLSSREAALRVGYTNDYVSRLCRTGQISGMLVGRSWYVDESDLLNFVARNVREKEFRQQVLSEERKDEYKRSQELPFELIETRDFSTRVRPSFLKRSIAFVGAVSLVFGVYFGTTIDELSADEFARKVNSFVWSVSTATPYTVYEQLSSATLHTGNAINSGAEYFLDPSHDPIQDLLGVARTSMNRIQDGRVVVETQLSSTLNATLHTVASVGDAPNIFGVFASRVASFAWDAGEKVSAFFYNAGRIVASRAMGPRDTGTARVDTPTHVEPPLAVNDGSVPSETTDVETTPEGLVVLPSTGDRESDDKLVTQVRQTFSDEVKVVARDESSGVIQPVFKHGPGKEHLYVLVPLEGVDEEESP